LSSQYSSLLENIVLVQLINSPYRTYFGNKKRFRHVIQKLNYLDNKAIVICNSNGSEYIIYFIIALLDDNCKDVTKFAYGVKEECIFNEIPHSISSMNITCDIMHDLFEGVCRYDLAKIIRYFRTENFFTIEHLNERIKYFN